MNNTSEQYYREIMSEMHLLDSHAHIPPEAAFQNEPKDFTEVVDYAYNDLISAGMKINDLHSPFDGFPPMSLSDGFDPLYKEPSVEEKWEIIKKYWPYVKNMGPGICARKTLQMYFGVDDFTDETIPAINAKFAELQKKSYREFYDEVKVDKVVNIAINGSYGNPATDVFSPLIYTDLVTEPVNRDYVQFLESVTKKNIFSLDSYVQALDDYLEKEVKENGMKGFKLHTTSFMRELEFSMPSKAAAELEFDKMITSTARGSLLSGKGRSYDEMHSLHNYLQNHLIQKSIELDVPVQIHTGTFGGSNGAKLYNSNPTLLSDLLIRYPQAKFDFLHSGFPYFNELAEMTREFPNLKLNVTWMQLLSPIEFIQYMEKLALWIPSNKIIGYGSDELTVLNSCATAEMYRDYMAKVLSDLTTNGYMTEKDAIFFANRVSRENAVEHFKL